MDATKGTHVPQVYCSVMEQVLPTKQAGTHGCSVGKGQSKAAAVVHFSTCAPQAGISTVLTSGGPERIKHTLVVHAHTYYGEAS